ncbi:fumarylacetoacetate hydrolase family protein [Catenulispora rubra]|uniref:fumarylacetoacetate hydrolase family protein n=1 Tax=Catenulispora rubra TaxID=280293 RepID=UPI00189285B4|nr:fumarylacetoacetate hydrolase family protein [Catenulispora rubra]
MRLTTIRVGDGTAAGRVDADTITVLPYADVGELLAAGPDWRERAGAAGPTRELAGADFAPLVPRPEKIVCVGVSYRDHAEEAGLAIPEYPTIFAKYARALIGAGDEIALTPHSQAVDWEVELGVVIGTAVRDADPDEALEAVAGYTIVNDVSVRDWQLRTSQFLAGKTFEGTTPVGPFLVTPEEVDHARALVLTCTVDGEVMQRGCTEDLVFPVARIVSFLSRIITLVPGDLIATGTPAGIGAARKPPVFLRDGQKVRCAIEGLGEQVNLCRSPAVAGA